MLASNLARMDGVDHACDLPVFKCVAVVRSERACDRRAHRASMARARLSRRALPARTARPQRMAELDAAVAHRRAGDAIADPALARAARRIAWNMATPASPPRAARIAPSTPCAQTGAFATLRPTRTSVARRVPFPLVGRATDGPFFYALQPWRSTAIGGVRAMRRDARQPAIATSAAAVNTTSASETNGGA